MDLFLLQLLAAYRADPVFTVGILVFSAIVGIIFGYVFLGPLLF
jgi:hypothetical protein